MILGLTILLLFRSYLPSIYYYCRLGMFFFPSFFILLMEIFKNVHTGLFVFFIQK